jgi:hypothetical protein
MEHGTVDFAGARRELRRMSGRDMSETETFMRTLKMWLDATEAFRKELEKVGFKTEVKVTIDATVKKVDVEPEKDE